jgi:2-oxoglutarate dehydrogenase E1 component
VWATGFIGRLYHTTFVGQKRFSLEGSEAVIPALHSLVNSVHENGIEEIVLGMSHRGRFTVLHTILGKSPEEIFSEFEDVLLSRQYGGSGDVKYHLGYHTDHARPEGSSVHVTLAPNSSHPESVDGMVEGKARAVQRRRGDTERRKVVPVSRPPDAAAAGRPRRLRHLPVLGCDISSGRWLRASSTGQTSASGQFSFRLPPYSRKHLAMG